MFTAETVWSIDDWHALDSRVRSRALRASSEQAAWNVIARASKDVLKRYSTSFFLVTRFLPAHKRQAVETIYAAVRYPDEIVDTFPFTPEQRTALLADWRDGFHAATMEPSLRASLRRDVPVFAAAFAETCRRASIPAQYYESFLDAMERDIEPQPYETLNDLIDNYVYGSAVVVGYFLTHVYGPSSPSSFTRARAAARDLGIALQLVNFSRDLYGDALGGRIYAPRDILAGEQVKESELRCPTASVQRARVIRRMGAVAEAYFRLAQRGVDAFAPDSRVAIQACIDVYRELNRSLIENGEAADSRASVPQWRKFQLLPRSKYWRVPLAYLTP
jgi:15-cis-phytoene synthase